ncbi:MAG: ImmA/IrrE family metallo-endopeptidase [Planctomycetia bacterium]|nr:ImmA/IrrE family metallo-endopeptidase [Planctomycetia bacterium]
MFAEIPHEQLAAALNECVAALLDRQRILVPPVDAVALARALQMEIVWDRGQAGRARMVRHSSAGGGGSAQAIVLRPEPRAERRHWAVAHEIGEAHAHEVFTALGIDPRDAPPASREWVANQLANRILLPQAWFDRDGRACGWDLFELKQQYATASHELIARRMLDCEPMVVITICDQGRPSFRGGNGAARCGPLRAVESACWREVQQHNQPAECADELGTVQGWPIHEPDWKREILRFAWSDEAMEF